MFFWIHTTNFRLQLSIFFKTLPLYYRFSWLRRLDRDFTIAYKTEVSSSQVYKERQNVDKPERDLVYGEVTYHGLEDALKLAPIRKNSVFLDMGCGRGKALIYLVKRYDIVGVGVDLIPSYISFAKEYVHKHNIRNIEFHLQDFLDTNLQLFTHILVPLTCLSAESEEAVIQHLKSVQPGCIVITTTRSIKVAEFDILGEVYTDFHWGEGHLNVHVRNQHAVL